MLQPIRRSNRIRNQKIKSQHQNDTTNEITLSSPQQEKQYMLRPGDFISYQSNFCLVKNMENMRIYKIYQGNDDNEVMVDMRNWFYPNSFVRVVNSIHPDAPPPDVSFLLEHDNDEGVGFEFGTFEISEEERVNSLHNSIDQLPGGMETHALVHGLNAARRSTLGKTKKETVPHHMNHLPILIMTMLVKLIMEHQKEEQ